MGYHNLLTAFSADAHNIVLPPMEVPGNLDSLLRRIGLCWQAPRAPQQSGGMGDAVVSVASPCLFFMLSVKSEKCQGPGDSVPGGSISHDRPLRDVSMEEAHKEHESDRRFSQAHWDMLKRSSDRKDITEWNQWRITHPDLDVLLEGADLSDMHLTGVNLATGVYPGIRGQVHLENTKFWRANLREADMRFAQMDHANLMNAHLEGSRLDGASLRHAHLNRAHLQNATLRFADLGHARLWHAHIEGANLSGEPKLQGADFMAAYVDNSTLLWKCGVNRYARDKHCTNFIAVAIDNMRIDPGTKQLLEYNIRRMNWEQWYKGHRISQVFVWLFWLASDYGRSTGRIAWVFFVTAIAFAFTYYVWGLISPPGIVDNLIIAANGVAVRPWLAPARSLFFSLVTMTVGFTDMRANPHSIWAYLLVTLQMLLGYVLLGALITRFAVLFTSGGPAGEFEDRKGIARRLRELVQRKPRKNVG